MERAPANAPDAGASRRHSPRHPLRVGSLAFGSIALALSLLPVIHRPPLRLLWNASASVPLGLYRIEPDTALRVGDLVALRPSPTLGHFMATRRYVEANSLLIKPVAAVSGAIVCRIGARVTIGSRPVAAALSRDRFGRTLPTWSGCGRVRANQLFLIAPAHADSFDSRYFGPIDRRRIVGRAIPVWTWS